MLKANRMIATHRTTQVLSNLRIRFSSDTLGNSGSEGISFSLVVISLTPSHSPAPAVGWGCMQ